MKSFYLLISFQLIHSVIFSQSSCLSTYFCSRNLNNHISGITINPTPYLLSYGKTSTNFKDVQYAENCCNSGCGYICGSDLSVLKYYVYYPTNYPNYSTCPLPAVVLFHGGAFNECGSFDDAGVKNMCQELAYRGFVCFDVNYRVGVIPDGNIVPNSNPEVDYTSAQQLLAVYKACQDARGAIRSIIQRQNDEGTNGINDPYRIDVNNLIIGGISAGSLIAMNSVYYQTPSMIDDVFGTDIQSTDATKGVLGPIDADYYYGGPSVEYFSKVKCVFNMWGSMFIPTKKINSVSNYFSQNTYMPPVISFQGQLDDVFNIFQQGVYYSTSNFRNIDVTKEKRCLIGTKYYKPNQLKKDPDLKSIGATTIYNSFKSSSFFTELYVDCDMHHGLDDDGTSFASNFGTPYNTQAQVYAYIAGREATFYQAIIGSITGSLNKSKFVECSNYRNTCTNTADNPSNCSNSSCND